MHEVVVVQHQGGLRAALYFILDLLAIALLIGSAFFVYRQHTYRPHLEPKPDEHILLPGSGRYVPVYES